MLSQIGGEQVIEEAPLTASAVPPQGATLAESVTAYLESLRRSKHLLDATKRAYTTDLRQFMAFAQQADIMTPNEVRPFHLDDWVMALDGQSAATVRRKLVSISRFFEWLMKREIVSGNPVSMAEKPKKKRGYGTAVTLDHYRRLLASCNTSRERALLATLFWGGCRRQEVIDLNIGHVDLTQSILTVRGKGEKVRRIAIAGNLAVHIEDHLAERRSASPGEPLFLNRDGKRLSTKSINGWFRTLCKHAGLSDLNYTPHSCRRGIANVLDSEGFSMFAIQNFLGHEDPKTTSLYVTDAGRTLLVKMRANPIFNDEVEERMPHDQVSRLEARFESLTSAVMALLERSSSPGQDGVYPLHEALQLGGGIGDDGHAVPGDKATHQ